MPGAVPIPSQLTLKQGRELYFQATGFSQKGYALPWVRIKLGPVAVFIPNTRSRQKVVPLHDLHHVLTGYSTDVLGEAEIGAWELASGCKGNLVAWVLNSLAVGLGFFLGPRRVWQAFALGRRCRNLYWAAFSENLLEKTVAEVRKDLGIPG